MTFVVPFTAPAGLPVITATATDPDGNTSEVTSESRGVLVVPSQVIRLAPGQPETFSAASGDGISLQDPYDGPLNLAWDLTLSVAAGTLTLSTTAGLTGSGDGTGSLSYNGPLSSLDAALDGLTFAPPPGYQGNLVLSLDAQSNGAATNPVFVQFVVTSGRFMVTTTADSGPGSLRQAILDSNALGGATNTIDFDIPATGVQTIAPLSPLPAITNPVLIDGESQPGYSGTPLIEISGSEADGGDGLLITGPDITVRGLDINSFGQGAGIHITGTGATGDWVYGNDLGTDPTGTQAEPNEYGVEIDGGAADNVIGTDGNGDETQQSNRISGNTNSGVDIGGADQTIGGFAPGSGDIAQLLTLNGSQVVEGGQLQLLGAIGAGERQRLHLHAGGYRPVLHPVPVPVP